MSRFTDRANFLFRNYHINAGRGGHELITKIERFPLWIAKLVAWLATLYSTARSLQFGLVNSLKRVYLTESSRHVPESFSLVIDTAHALSQPSHRRRRSTSIELHPPSHLPWIYCVKQTFPILNPRSGTMPRRPYLRFCLPDQQFSWTDSASVLTLSEDDLQHLRAECAFATAVLDDEDLRRNQKGSRPSTAELQRFFRCLDSRSLLPEGTPIEAKRDTRVPFVISRLGGVCLTAPTYFRLSHLEGAKVTRLAIGAWSCEDGFLRPPNPGPLATPSARRLPKSHGNSNWAATLPVAQTIVFAGNSVPPGFFSDCNSWSSDGEIQTSPTDFSAWRQDVESLQQHQLLEFSDGQFQVVQHLAEAVLSKHRGQAGIFRSKAWAQIFRVFPKHGGKDPER